MSTETMPCPICGEPAEHEPAETVDNGVGEVPVGPDSWVCDTHGHIWWSLDGKQQHIQHPDAKPERPREPAPAMFDLPPGGAE